MFLVLKALDTRAPVPGEEPPRHFHCGSRVGPEAQVESLQDTSTGWALGLQGGPRWRASPGAGVGLQMASTPGRPWFQERIRLCMYPHVSLGDGFMAGVAAEHSASLAFLASRVECEKKKPEKPALIRERPHGPRQPSPPRVLETLRSRMDYRQNLKPLAPVSSPSFVFL